MRTELRPIRERGPHNRRDYSLGRERWAVLYGVDTMDGATAQARCECGVMVCFTTDGGGHLVALEARSRDRHECEEAT